MTVPTEETDGYTSLVDADLVEHVYQPPIPVFIANDRREQASHFGALAGWTIPVFNAGQVPIPVQILQRRPSRNRAVIYNPQSQAQGTSGQTTGTLNVTAPAQTIASLTLPAGTYAINWALILGGVPTASDDNNVQLLVGSTVVATVNNGSTVSFPYPQLPLTVTIPAGGAVLSAQSVGAGSAAATYRVQLNASASAVNAQVLLSSNRDQLQLSPPIGYPLDSGIAVTLESQQPLYAVCSPATVTAVTLGVLDEAWLTKDGN